MSKRAWTQRLQLARDLRAASRSLLSIRTTLRTLALAVLVGVVAGGAAIGLALGIAVFNRLLLNDVAGWVQTGAANERIPEVLQPEPATFHPLLLLVIITAGGLVAGWFIYSFAPTAEGHGTDTAIRAYHRGDGRIGWKVPIVKLVASVITLGTGGAGGREGPIALTGAGAGSVLATLLPGTDAGERRTLLAAGIGGGIGAIFGAPLAGALFAAEVLYRKEEFEGGVVMSSLVAAAVGYLLFGLVVSFDPLLAVDLPGGYTFPPALIAVATVLAVLMALAGGLFVRCFYAVKGAFDRLPFNRKLHPMLGAALTGGVALTAYGLVAAVGGSSREQDLTLGTLGLGYGFLQQMLLGGFMGVSMLVLLAVGLVRIVTTSLTIGSGGSAGVFGTSLVISAALGAGSVGIVEHAWPDLLDRGDAIALILLGMVAFFSSAAKTPVSTLVMVVELTGVTAIIFPGVWVAAIGFLLSGTWTIYREQVADRSDSGAHGAVAAPEAPA